MMEAWKQSLSEATWQCIRPRRKGCRADEMWSYSQRQQIRENNRKRKVSLHIGLVSYRKECGKMQYEITSQKSILMQARRIAKNPASSVILLLDFFLLSVALHHYPGLFNRTNLAFGNFGLPFGFGFGFGQSCS